VRDAARRAEGQGFRNRRPNDTARGLQDEPAQTQAGRGSLRLGKTIAGLAKVKVHGLPRVRFKFTFAMAAYNLIRMPRLLAAA